MKNRLIILTLVLAVLLGGCVEDTRISTLEARIEALETQVRNQQFQLDTLHESDIGFFEISEDWIDIYEIVNERLTFVEYRVEIFLR